MPNSQAGSDKRGTSSLRGMRGYSIVELVVVGALLAILTAMSLPYFVNYSRMYKSEDQALKVMDLMREAGQMALTRRRTIRLEIDRNNIMAPVVRLTDEESGNSLKTIPLAPLNQVRMDVAPQGVGTPPSNYAAAAYSSNVWTIKFKSDGSVVNAAGTAPVSATLYSWRPIMEKNTPFNISDLNPARAEEVRAVTIFGGSGAVRYWKYTGSAWVAAN